MCVCSSRLRPPQCCSPAYHVFVFPQPFLLSWHFSLLLHLYPPLLLSLSPLFPDGRISGPVPLPSSAVHMSFYPPKRQYPTRALPSPLSTSISETSTLTLSSHLFLYFSFRSPELQPNGLNPIFPSLSLQHVSIHPLDLLPHSSSSLHELFFCRAVFRKV